MVSEMGSVEDRQADNLRRIKDRFQTDGFAVVRGLVGKKGLAELQAAYDDALSGKTDFEADDRHLGGLTRQLMNPHLHDARFAENEAVRNAAQIAGGIIGTSDLPLMFSMLIYKPPGHRHETPWHQDMAYAGRPVTEAGATLPNDAILQFWLALDDVDEETGCMTFIPGKQADPMPEHIVSSGDPDDEGRLMAMTHPERDLDLSKAVPCALDAGSATVHGYAAPHYTGPNRTKDRHRRAFIFSFANANALAAIAGDRGDWQSHDPLQN
ncbi:MAG: phytanoyl-CoA dioxygenase family protein [Erythrobacter sp.]|uniref:phytanoyl-CoA dioxygenase family protein n=1 Tax=Erythrobacter sp. TaxID=1042 RepID=UPI002610DDCC|nr:phytanoyl-CoA dioxygenase family protein [Erythrobacter sp.]MDJ0979094.1 phytanoyl-CoA dioxygenase family protein [Erythrobacter sp.]